MNDYKKEDILVGIFILAFICAVIFCCTCGKNIYDNGYGADKVRDELTNAQAAQRAEASVIDETAESIGKSEKAIDDSTEANKQIADTERADAEIIDACEQILARVREKNQEKNPEP